MDGHSKIRPNDRIVPYVLQLFQQFNCFMAFGLKNGDCFYAKG